MVLEGDELLRAVASLAGSAASNRAVDPAPILAAARKLRRIFSLPMPDAPGLVFVGGDVEIARPAGTRAAIVSVAGSGADLLEATASCVGEAVEAMSRQDDGHHRTKPAPVHASMTGLDAAERCALLAMLPPHAAATAQIEWLAARRWPSQAEVAVPAALCLAAASIEQPPLVPMSLGCGAGPTTAHAVAHGLCEVIERDAVALWWIGGAPARALAPNVEATARNYLAALRRNQNGRATRVLDITTDTGVPSCVAVSSDTDGRALAFGFAARPSFDAACAAAIREMCQMELGLRLIAMKRQQRGSDALNDADRLFLARAFAIAAGDITLSDRPGDGRLREVGLQEIGYALTALRCSVLVADLSRADLAISAVRVLVPGLQPYPSALVTPRLQRVIDRTGGGPGLGRALRLM